MISLLKNSECKQATFLSRPSGCASRRGVRTGFTLVELLLVISIIAVLALLAVAVIRSAEDDARASRTQTIVTKINQVIQRRMEAYETRTLPFRLDTNLDFAARNQVRNQVLAEWIRGEMPTTKADLGAFGSSLPSLQQPSMVRRLSRQLGPANADWTAENEGAECLYAILKNSWDGDNRGTHFLTPTEIGDTDGDQRLEVLDGWGEPLRFTIAPNANIPVDPIDPNNPVTLNDYIVTVGAGRTF